MYMKIDEHVREDIWESFPQKTAAAENSSHKYQTYLSFIIKQKPLPKSGISDQFYVCLLIIDHKFVVVMAMPDVL